MIEICHRGRWNVDYMVCDCSVNSKGTSLYNVELEDHELAWGTVSDSNYIILTQMPALSNTI